MLQGGTSRRPGRHAQNACGLQEDALTPTLRTEIPTAGDASRRPFLIIPLGIQIPLQSMLAGHQSLHDDRVDAGVPRAGDQADLGGLGQAIVLHPPDKLAAKPCRPSSPRSLDADLEIRATLLEPGCGRKWNRLTHGDERLALAVPRAKGRAPSSRETRITWRLAGRPPAGMANCTSTSLASWRSSPIVIW